MVQHIVTASPATVELDEAPFPSDWVIDGSPRARAKEIARSDDTSMKVIVWSCTRGRFRWQYDVDEMVQILSGEVVITDHNGKERRLTSGDTAFFPAGTWSVWHVTEDVRKIAVCRNTMPRVVTFGLRAWGWGARRAQSLLTANTARPGFSGGSLGVAAR